MTVHLYEGRAGICTVPGTEVNGKKGMATLTKFPIEQDPEQYNHYLFVLTAIQKGSEGMHVVAEPIHKMNTISWRRREEIQERHLMGVIMTVDRIYILLHPSWNEKMEGSAFKLSLIERDLNRENVINGLNTSFLPPDSLLTNITYESVDLPAYNAYVDVILEEIEERRALLASKNQ